jgi:hypothetical protein
MRFSLLPVAAVAGSLLAAACSSSSGGSKPAGGPASTTLAAQPVTIATGVSGEFLAMDDANVYGASYGSGGGDSGGVLRYSLSGGTPTALATFPQDSGPAGLVVVGSTVYYALDTYSTNTTQGLIVSVPVKGGASTTVVSATGSIGSLATDGTDLYWTESAPGTTCNTVSCVPLLRAPLAGGTPVTITTAAHSPTCFAYDASHVYWGNGDGFLLAAPKAGGSVTVLADYASTSFEALALSGSTLTWGASGGDVYQTPTAGGSSKAIEVGASSMSSAAFTSKGLVWASESYDYMASGNGESGFIALTPLDGGATSTLWSSSDDGPSGVIAQGSTVVVVMSSGSMFRLSL